MKVRPPLEGVALLGARRSLGRFELTVVGQIGKVCTIEVSTNLVHWTNMTSIVATNQTNTVIDGYAWMNSQRFYRARYAP